MSDQIKKDISEFIYACTVHGILQANPHLKLGCKMTGPLGIVTKDGQDATQVAGIPVSPLTQDVPVENLNKTIIASTVKIKLPIELNDFVLNEPDKKYLHPYMVVVDDHALFFDTAEVGDEFTHTDPETLEAKKCIITQELKDTTQANNFVKFRFALS